MIERAVAPAAAGQKQAQPRSCPPLERIEPIEPERAVRRRLDVLRGRALDWSDSAPRGERLRLVTESYRQTEGLPPVLRRARAVAHFLRYRRIDITPEETLVGVQQRYVTCHRGLDQLNMPWLQWVDFPEARRGRYRQVLSQTPAAFRGDMAYWAAQPAPPLLNVDPAARRAAAAGVLSYGGGYSGHSVAGYPRVLRLGLRGIQAEARARLARVPAGLAHGPERDFLAAVLAVTEGVIDYAGRYAVLAAQQAAREPDSARRRELRRIAAICRRVPAEPARTFREAVQCVWFVQRAVEAEGGDTAVAHSLGRLDQYLYPYYRADLVAGRLTRAETDSLLTELYYKLLRVYSDQHIMVGGVTRDGRDGTNDLSYLLLAIHSRERLLIDVGARVHRETPAAFWEACAQVMRTNPGFCLFGDEPTVAALVDAGDPSSGRVIPVEDARDYAVTGCVEIVVPAVAAPRTMEFRVNAAKCVELALNRGRCALTGEQVGPDTGDPASFADFEVLWTAFARQLAHAVALAAAATNRGQARSSDLPVPFLSCTYEDPVQNARDMTAGGCRFNGAAVQLADVASAADALAAVEQLVFCEGRVSLAALLEALHRNWEAEGDEALRQRCLRRAPNYGNDDPRADVIASRMANLYADLVRGHRTHFGDPYLPMIYNVTTASVHLHGPHTGALPDGRRAGEPLPAALNPYQGRDVKGPAAAFRSVTAVDATRLPGGTSYITEIHPSYVAGREGPAKFTAMLRAFFAMGGQNLAVNVVDAATLRAAQREPDRYRHLSIRLFGYSEYFVNLDRDLQDYVIAKCERDAAHV